MPQLQPRSFPFLAVILSLALSLLVPFHSWAAQYSQNPRTPSLDQIISDDSLPFLAAEPARHESQDYEPEFLGQHRSIIGRQDSTGVLKNNIPNGNDDGLGVIALGETQHWSFSEAELKGTRSTDVPVIPPAIKAGNRGLVNEEHPELKKRQSGDTILYLSLSICDLPRARTSNPRRLPQLNLYIGGSPNNKEPGPNSNDPEQRSLTTEYGYCEYVNPRSGNLYFGVSAPNDTDYEGSYSYEITASIDERYSNYKPYTSLDYVDSDSGASVMVTTDLTQNGTNQEVVGKWMDTEPVFSVFLYRKNDTQVDGLRRSFCGLKNKATVIGNVGSRKNSSIESRMILSNENTVKQQFFVPNLNSSTPYLAILGLNSNYTKSGAGVVGGGGTVWREIEFTTKSDGNCRIVHDLSFCSNVNYAVPSNPKKFPDIKSLAAQYDNMTSDLFQNFVYSLKQVACDTNPESQYSLAVTCDDCTRAYKQWLCAVTMPRCADFSSTQQYLQARNIGQDFINGSTPSSSLNPIFSDSNKQLAFMNFSRNSFIDTVIQPGPYKEILPCDDLCNKLVQSCPSALGFSCPSGGKGSSNSYGTSDVDLDGNPKCNNPGAFLVNSASRARRPLMPVAIFLTMVLQLFLG